MSSVSSDSTWKVYNQIAKKVLAQKNVEGQDLKDLFLAVEHHIFYALDLLIQHTTFVEDNLCYLLSEIGTGIIKSRKVYKGKRTKKRTAIGEKATMGVENYRILSTGFDLFKLSKCEREKAAPLVKRIVRALKLATHIYENIVRAFVNKTESYTLLVDALLYLRIKDETNPKIKEIVVQIKDVEKSVGCDDTNNLYGVVSLVRLILDSICKVQEKIIKAYQKMILKPARRKARSENEALENFQAGNMGLAHATSVFDLDSNASFSTFANFWINQKILGFSKRKGPLIKLPWSTWESFQLIRRVEREFEDDPVKRYNYTDADIAKELNKSVRSVQKVREKVQTIKVIPLDDIVRNQDGTDSNLVKGEMLIDPSFEQTAELEDYRKLIRTVLKKLSPLEKKIICLRFGLIDELKNDVLDPTDVAKELLRQTACKAATYVYITEQQE